MKHCRGQVIEVCLTLVTLASIVVCAAGWRIAARAAEVQHAQSAPVDFVKDVQPILSARCYECHGPEKQKGGFRADSKESIFLAGDSGEKRVVPGDVGKSHLIALVR